MFFQKIWAYLVGGDDRGFGRFPLLVLYRMCKRDLPYNFFSREQYPVRDVAGRIVVQYVSKREPEEKAM